MLKNSTDRSDNSKEWMIESLFILMMKKKFKSISISDIAQKAGVDRRTFYRHFSSKEDIIRFKIRKMSKEYEKIILSHDNFKTKAVFFSFFTVCEQEKESLLCLYKSDLLPLFLKEFERLFEMHYSKNKKIELTSESVVIKYLLAYHIGGFWNVLNKWLSEGAIKTPDEMTTILLSTLPG